MISRLPHNPIPTHLLGVGYAISIQACGMFQRDKQNSDQSVDPPSQSETVLLRLLKMDQRRIKDRVLFSNGSHPPRFLPSSVGSGGLGT